ncbi:hypothetical protein DNU06_02165 [Putridiphycobacter roseus]|uniref:Glycosyltransferase RgtA/B/C/D-like domain-containing protein n=1 Tax=Putridiphycobacter roseus TaxID=2219161 RepID=A0A2W1NLE1_9FLAO|nr:hypothetical protein [Putridiphycobacter roseus]PZE18656.1 hypothetical protein DNU06_02165 [Putridiphycobacter roseus]
MISLADWGIWIIYLGVITIILWFLRDRKQPELAKFYLPGFYVKVFGGVAFVVIYIYHYKGVGDTFLYFNGAKVLANAMVESPVDYFRLILSSSNNLPPDLYRYTQDIFYAHTAEEWFMVKLLSPIVLLSFKSYLVTTLLVSVFSFFGAWKLFKVFNHALKSYPYLAFGVAFLIPSTVFFGGGVIKDTVTMVGISVVIYALYFGLRERMNLKLMLIALFWAFIILNLKAYIILSFLPSFFIIVYIFFRSRSQNKMLRLMITPMLIAFIAAVAYLSFQNLPDISEKYNQNNLEKKLKGFHTWHATIGESAYSLGEIEYTPLGVMKKVPAALMTTFFKPYVWKARNPVVLLSALESLFIFILFFLVTIKTRFKYFKYLPSGFFRALVSFVLLFGFIVGFTSYNFGALARYKIPVIPVFVFILILILLQVREKEKEAKIKPN